MTTAKLAKKRRRVTELVMLKPRQLAAALKLIGWTADDLADASGTSRHTVFAYVSRGSNPKLGTVEAWIHALHKAGVILYDEDDQAGMGIRLRKGTAVPVPKPPEAKGKGRRGA